jgi:hypothetical protein
LSGAASQIPGLQWSPRRVPNVQHVHGIPGDCEENPIDIPPFTEQQLPKLNTHLFGFRGQPAALRLLFQRLHGLS